MITKTYNFPIITEEEYNILKQWYNTHNEGKCKNAYAGAVGGDLTFEVTPISNASFVEVKCVCGDKLELGIM